MQQRDRRPLLRVVVSCLVLSLALPALAQSNIGTWTLNVAKSKYSNNNPPKSTTLTIEGSGNVTTTTVDTVAGDGSSQRWGWRSAYDGRDVRITGNNPNADTASRRRVSPSTTETTFKKAGKVTTINTAVVSDDGKSMTITAKGTDAQGKAVLNVQVFEKKPGPGSR
jgi:hypothetical protein